MSAPPTQTASAVAASLEPSARGPRMTRATRRVRRSTRSTPRYLRSFVAPVTQREPKPTASWYGSIGSRNTRSTRPDRVSTRVTAPRPDATWAASATQRSFPFRSRKPGRPGTPTLATTDVPSELVHPACGRDAVAAPATRIVEKRPITIQRSLTGSSTRPDPSRFRIGGAVRPRLAGRRRAAQAGQRRVGVRRDVAEERVRMRPARQPGHEDRVVVPGVAEAAVAPEVVPVQRGTLRG